MKRLVLILILLPAMGCGLGNVLNRPTGPDALFRTIGPKKVESYVSITGEPSGACTELTVRSEPVPTEVRHDIDSALTELEDLRTGAVIDELRVLMTEVYTAEDIEEATRYAAAVERRLTSLEGRIDASGIDDLRSLWDEESAGEVSAGCSLPVESYDGRQFSLTCLGGVAEKCRECGSDPRRCTVGYSGPYSIVGEARLIVTEAKQVSIRIR